MVFYVAGARNHLADWLTRWGASRPPDQPIQLYALHRFTAHSWDNVADALRAHAVRRRRRRPTTPVTLGSQLPWFTSDRVSPLNPWYHGTWEPIPLHTLLAAQPTHTSADFLSGGDPLLLTFDLACNAVVCNHLQPYHPLSLKRELENLKRFQLDYPDNQSVTLEDLVRCLRRKCLHCQRVPRVIRRPYNLTFFADYPGKILHSDFLHVNEAGYIITLMDNLSGKVLLEYASRCTAEAVVKAVLTWRSHFTLQEDFVLVTDNGSHYANQLVESLRKDLRFSHTLTVA